MNTLEQVARILAETSVTKDPRRFGFDCSERYTVQAVSSIVERIWQGYTPEAAALEQAGMIARLSGATPSSRLNAEDAV